MPTEFITLPYDKDNELQSMANLLWEELRRRGYRLKAEPNILELPSTPTMEAKRQHETHYFLVTENIDELTLDQWLRFAQSCTRDTRVSLCCINGGSIAASRIGKLRKTGIGLVIKSENALQFVCEGKDLAFHAAAPDRNSLKPRVRSLLGEPLDRFEGGDWRTAFGDACAVLEQECISYLLRNHGMNRVKFKVGNKTQIPSKAQIRKMTLGALKDAFCGMTSQNQIEASLCAALSRLNRDRIIRTHTPGQQRSETALRKRVGTHMWLISNSLALLV